MNKKNHNTSFVLSLLMALLLFSCSQEQENNDFFDLTSMPAVSVEGELIDEYLMAYKSNQMKFIQSKLFHFEPTEQEVCLVTTEENDTDKKGKAPDKLSGNKAYKKQNENQPSFEVRFSLSMVDHLGLEPRTDRL